MDHDNPPAGGPRPTDRRTVLHTGLAGLAALSLPTSALGQPSGDGPIVHTAAGALRGAYDNGVYTFKGVRYGEDTAARRFQAPEPVRPWTGVRDALGYGPHSPQPVFATFPVYKEAADPSEASEDCLFLNVTTPSITTDKRRPVMVWLHGGGYVSMSGNFNIWDGERFVRRHDVVMVTVTHRLGVFGYLYLADLLGPKYADSGNAGMLDIVLALQWVRDNAAAFGGDPDNVMIYGESGGGGKVSTLMAMPAAKGLFHRAGVQSGSMLTAISPTTAAQTTQNLLTALKVQPQDAAQLTSLSVADLLKGFHEMSPNAGTGASPLGPVLDGVILPRDPFKPDAPLISNTVPMLIGTNLTETTLFYGGDEGAFHLTWEGLSARLPVALHAFGSFFPAHLEDTEAAIRAARRLMPDATPSDLYFLLTTEAFRGAAIRQAELASQRPAPAYMYLFEWETPVDGGKWRSPHSLDVAMVMDTVATFPSTFGTGMDRAQVLSDKVTAAWAAFARTGDPNTPLLPHWPAYDAANRETMILDDACRVESDPNGGLRKLFETT